MARIGPDAYSDTNNSGSKNHAHIPSTTDGRDENYGLNPHDHTVTRDNYQRVTNSITGTQAESGVICSCPAPSTVVELEDVLEYILEKLRAKMTAHLNLSRDTFLNAHSLDDHLKAALLLDKARGMAIIIEDVSTHAHAYMDQVERDE